MTETGAGGRMAADVVRVARCPRHGPVLVTVDRALAPWVATHASSPGPAHRFPVGAYTVHWVFPLPVVPHG